MAAVPLRLRRIAAASLPDPDWPGTQVAPSAAILADVTGTRRIGAVWRGLDASNAPVAAGGTLDLQLVDVATSQVFKGVPATTLVRASAVDTGIGVGIGLEYDVAGSRAVTIRVADASALDASVVTVEIWWTTLE